MIGKVATDLSQSSLGMLSAKQIDMETRFINFDLNSLLGSFDDAVAVVPEKDGNRSFDQQNGKQFLDQFVKAGGTAIVETTSTEGSLVPLTAKTNGQPIESRPETVFDLSDSFPLPGALSVVGDLSPMQTQNASPTISKVQDDLPSSESAQKHITVENVETADLENSSQTISPEVDGEGIENDDGNLLAPPVRNPASLKFNEWENGFAAQAPINDNFSAVESAIAKYSARKDWEKQLRDDPSGLTEQDQQDIKSEAPIEQIQASSRPIDLQNLDSHVNNQPENDRAVTNDKTANTVNEIDDETISKQLGSPHLFGSTLQPSPNEERPLDTDNIQTTRDGRQKQKVISASAQPEAQITSLQNSNNTGSLNVFVNDPDEVVPPRDTQDHSQPVRPNKTIPAAPEILSFRLPVTNEGHSPATVDARMQSADLSSDLNVRPVTSNQKANDQFVAEKPVAVIDLDKSILGAESRSSKAQLSGNVAHEETAHISFHKNGQSSVVEKVPYNAPENREQPALSAADSSLVINQDRSTSILPAEDGNKPLGQSQAAKTSTETVVQANLPQSAAAKAQPIDNPQVATAELPVQPERVAESTRMAASIKRAMGATISIVSDAKSVDADVADTQPTKQSYSLAEPSGINTKNLVQPSKILDSLYVRQGHKIDHGQPVEDTKPTSGPAKSDLAEPRHISNNLELPINAGEKNIPSLTSAQISNPTTPIPAPKTSTFDWNAPKFVERFASEISDLSVNGDLKKFEINPKNLGRLEIALIARGTSEFVRIEAESQAARDVIVQHSQAIQEMLRAQGRSDLSIRVDLKEAGFATNSESNNQQLAQQDGTGTRDDRSNHKSGNRASLAPDILPETETKSDEGRYA